MNKEFCKKKVLKEKNNNLQRLKIHKNYYQLYFHMKFRSPSFTTTLSKKNPAGLFSKLLLTKYNQKKAPNTYFCQKISLWSTSNIRTTAKS